LSTIHTTSLTATCFTSAIRQSSSPFAPSRATVVLACVHGWR
jgi:hypothetical protein